MIETKSVHYSEEDGAHKPGIPEDHAAFTAEPFLAPIVEARKMSVGRRRSTNRPYYMEKFRTNKDTLVGAPLNQNT
jgi:hypothetical protein